VEESPVPRRACTLPSSKSDTQNRLKKIPLDEVDGIPILYTQRCPSSSCKGRYHDIFNTFVVFCEDEKHHLNHGLGWAEDYFCSLVANRRREEALEETDDLQLAVEFEKEHVEMDGLTRKD
jgi:hypothetical protein